ncbi:Protein gar2 [Auxenochlorella protothecoides]|uniref:Protein gar2 n=1 Tax=Auxenochlorella protothecoides TaxID=3075 RepID=A0A087SE55_AUXPR|nr:Protein gar2 [Auxenochlorella protothecoides]KFM24009.1 Protein gar2 [Auxenochlorella protothecoides]
MAKTKAAVKPAVKAAKAEAENLSKKKQGSKKKVPEPESSSEESSSDEEVAAVVESSSSEESSDEEPAVPAKKAAASKKAPAKKAADGSAVDASAANGSKTIFIKNLPWAADEDALREFFAEAGPIAEVRIAYDRETGRARGFAHLSFETVEGAAKAITLSGQELAGREVYIESTTEREQRTPGQDRFAASEGQTLFVKGFDSSLGEDDVRAALTEAFGAYGEVTNVRLPTDRETGSMRGIGFVEFSTSEAKNAAIELDGAEPRMSIDAGASGTGQNKKMTFDD